MMTRSKIADMKRYNVVDPAEVYSIVEITVNAESMSRARGLFLEANNVFHEVELNFRDWSKIADRLEVNEIITPNERN